MLMRAFKDVNLEEIVRIRLEFLKKQKGKHSRAFMLISAGILMQLPTDFIPMDVLAPTFPGDFVLATLFTFVIISSALILFGATFLGIFTHGALRINYLSLLDMIRLLAFFTVVLAGFSTIVWIALGVSCIMREISEEVILGLLFWAYYTDRMIGIVMSFSFLLLIVTLIKNKKILQKILKIRPVHVIYVLCLLNLLAFLFNLLSIFASLVLVLPTSIFMAYNPKFVYMYAYTDLNLSSLEK
ncbi:MAG: hypothetical protein NDP13_02980 [Crenarchaeota archaeon]|nr:hypothetical protein [Thermoproteota archaeon]